MSDGEKEVGTISAHAYSVKCFFCFFLNKQKSVREAWLVSDHNGAVAYVSVSSNEAGVGGWAMCCQLQ